MTSLSAIKINNNNNNKSINNDDDTNENSADATAATASLDNNGSSSSIRTRNRLGYASLICGTFVVVEFIGGYFSGSLSVWSDAVHLCTDLFAFLIAMMASHFAASTSSTKKNNTAATKNDDDDKKKTNNNDKKFTWGYNRLESLAALFSVSLLVIVTMYLLWESISRFVMLFAQHHGHEYEEQMMDALVGIDTTTISDNTAADTNTTETTTTINSASSNNNTTDIHGSTTDTTMSSSGGFVNGELMSGTAALGVFVNILLALVLKENHVHLPGSSCNHDHGSTGGGVNKCGDGCNHDHGRRPRPPRRRLPITTYDKLNENEQATTATTSNTDPVAGHFEMMNMYNFCQPCAIDDDNTSPPPPPPVIMSSSFAPPPRPQLAAKRLPPRKKNSKKQRYESLETIDTDIDIELGSTIGGNETNNNINDDAVAATTTSTSNINLDAAYLHALTDLAQSVLVLVVGVVIWYEPTWYWLDPILTFCFCIMVLYSSKPIFVRSLTVLLDVCPPDNNDNNGLLYDRVQETVHRCLTDSSSSIRPRQQQQDVIDVDNLRIWYISDGRIGLTVHITIRNNSSSSNNVTIARRRKNPNTFLLNLLQSSLQREFGIQKDDATIQISSYSS